MTRVFVVDTSYLTELYGVPGFSDRIFSAALRRRMARLASARFQVPVGCLYKLCDHIADVPDGNIRRALANKVAEDVRSSAARAVPWIIAPHGGLLDLVESVHAFAADASRLRLNLTNSETIDIADGLKAKYRGMSNYRVHIWSRNQRLKSHEPDREPNPL